MSGSVVSCVNQFRHAVSDGDGSRAIAIVVSVYYCVTASCILKGRKMTARNKVTTKIDEDLTFLMQFITFANSTSKCKFTTSNLKTPQLELKN